VTVTDEQNKTLTNSLAN